MRQIRAIYPIPKQFSGGGKEFLSLGVAYILIIITIYKEKATAKYLALVVCPDKHGISLDTLYKRSYKNLLCKYR